MPPATYVEDQPTQCGMYQWDIGGERCEEPTIAGSKFCAEHSGMKLCKTSGIHYQYKGNSGWSSSTETIYPHVIGYYPYTKRAEFCSDRCRNLWRDTKKTRERQVVVNKLLNGERSERYAIINNYRNSGEAVVLDKNTNRICGAGSI